MNSLVGKIENCVQNKTKLYIPAIFLWASGLALWVRAATFKYSACEIKPAASRLPGDMAEYSSLSSSIISDSISKNRIWLSGSAIKIKLFLNNIWFCGSYKYDLVNLSGIEISLK